jgi:hypothetical protein
VGGGGKLKGRGGGEQLQVFLDETCMHALQVEPCTQEQQRTEPEGLQIEANK